MTMLAEGPDHFTLWCLEHGYISTDEQRDHFAEWVELTTGWDGQIE